MGEIGWIPKKACTQFVWETMAYFRDDMKTLKDKNVLEKIHALKQEEVIELSPAQQTGLDKRLKKYERGI
jgi:hypothetical protein